MKINDNIRSSTNISNSYSYSDGFNPYFYIAPKATATGVATDTELGVVRADQSTINSTKNSSRFSRILISIINLVV